MLIHLFLINKLKFYKTNLIIIRIISNLAIYSTSFGNKNLHMDSFSILKIIF